MEKGRNDFIPKPVSRRRFLKASAVTAGATALGLGAGRPVLRALTAASQDRQIENQGEKIFQSSCFNNCFSHCRQNVHVRDGKVVKTSLASFPDNRYDRICLRGLAHPQRIYSPDRIKYPMKRAGERGSNQWERISWDEAIRTIAKKFGAVQEKYGKTALGFHVGTGDFGTLNGTNPGSIGLLQKALGVTNISLAVDAGFLPGINRVCGFWPGAWNINEHADVIHSKNIYVWGHKMEVAAIHHWHFVAEAMENGAKLTVFDPNYTGLAAKAHRHVSMYPGTDIALLMSMIQVIIDEKIYDKAFLLAHTCAPFLVREDNGLYLRMSDFGVAPTQGPVNPMTGKASMIDLNVVWDPATESAVAVNKVFAPALEGTFTVKGLKVRTAFDLLKDRVAAYTPEKAVKITDVNPEVIRSTARDFARIKPSTSIIGFGSQAYDNGPIWGHAIATLHAITGQIGKPGSFIGNTWFAYLGVNYSLAAPESIPMLYLPELIKNGTVKGKPRPPVKALWVSHANPLTAWVDSNYWINTFWPTLDFVVVADEQYTDTVRYADMVLPTAHWFEREDILTLGGTHPFIQHGEKAIEPCYESKPDVDIHRLIATGMGVGESFAATNEELLKLCFETPHFAKMGFTVENVRKQKALRFQPPGYVAWQDLKFTTSSGRMEFYCEHPLDQFQAPVPVDRLDSQRLPMWVPPREASRDNPLFKKYPFVLMSERPRFRVHTQWYNIEWLRELDPEPTLLINPKDAAKRGIKDGDYVEAFNDRGHAVAKAVLSEGIRPGVLSYPKGWHKQQYKAGCFSELDHRAFDSVGVNQSFFDALADIRKWKGSV
ncbi:MAG: molybdopterin-dependent oxidoreductase [Desulfatitalea sp.]|nr:molybdopterin-dependent oxidoreductase [Desulfatitalea sp.]NNK02683.1 molybdopterin-dependent oxidoreductase [Desulfatitalea sp.]